MRQLTKEYDLFYIGPGSMNAVLREAADAAMQFQAEGRYLENVIHSQYEGDHYLTLTVL